MGDLLSWPKWTRRQKIANLESEYNAWTSLQDRWGDINELIEALNNLYWLDGSDEKIKKQKQQ